MLVIVAFMIAVSIWRFLAIKIRVLPMSLFDNILFGFILLYAWMRPQRYDDHDDDDHDDACSIELIDIKMKASQLTL